MNQCIHCGAPLPPGALGCQRCGRWQTPNGAPPPGHGQQAHPSYGPGALPPQNYQSGHQHQSVPPPSGPIPSQPNLGNANAAPATMAVSSIAMLQVHEGQFQQTFPLVGTLTIGRAPDNNVVLKSPYTSGKHAKIEPEGNAHKITDVGSRNGIIYNGQRIQQHVLADGDVIRIPDPSTANFVTFTYVNPLAQRASPADAAVQSFPVPPGRPVVSIGRAGTDIVLPNPQVSRVHALIFWQGNMHVVQDKSINGTFVNGERATTPRPIRPGDVIQIGPYKLKYDGDSLDTFDQSGALRIDARNLHREVPNRSGPGTKILLNDISLSIAPREFVALVGGSGTGKSTLMMALSGFVKAEKGKILVNGDDYYANFDAYRSILGYVPQDDILHRELPVEMALMYAAKLKLPPDMKEEDLKERVRKVLDAVDMTIHKDKLIDNLSGGQRKRVSIASELLNDPSLLFLDEPTSGLDPGLEKKMMYTLRQLADGGRTVVLVTHATANITQCDHVVFMSTGRMVYFGPPSEALGFFGVTTGDFADIYTKLEGKVTPNTAEAPWIIVQQNLAKEYEAYKQQNPSQEPWLSELWEMKFKRSPQYQKYVVDRLAKAPLGPAVGHQSHASKQSSKPKQSPFRQFSILTKRYIDLVLQDRRNLGIMLAQAPIIGLLMVLVCKDALVPPTQHYFEAKKFLFLMATVGVWFGVINAAREICKESAIFRRERLADLRVGPYVLSKVAVLVALVVVQSFLLLVVVNLRVAFPSTGVLLPAPIEMFISTTLAGIAGLSIGLLISALSSTPDKAISLVPLVLIPQILFAGMIFKLEGATSILSWFTASSWTLDAYGTIADVNGLAYGAKGFVCCPDIPGHPTEHLNMCHWIDNPSMGALRPYFQQGITQCQVLDLTIAQEHAIQHVNPLPFKYEDQFRFSAVNLISRWFALAIYSTICVGLTHYILRRQKT